MAKSPIKKILISVSGGRTSGYMARWMLNNRDKVAAQIGINESELEYIFAFANTGLEHDDTLRFMRDTDQHFALNCTWLEGVPVYNERVSTQFRVVDFGSAYRLDQYKDVNHPYHAHIIKYGVPNLSYKNCTRELKRNTINNWMKSQGMHEKRDFYTAIGIRADEVKRCAKKPEDRNLIYPLVDWHPVSNADVLEFWQGYDWDLAIPREQGNCVACFEKSQSNLKKAFLAVPLAFEVIAYFEKKYTGVGPEFIKYDDAQPRAFFRSKQTTEQLIQSFSLTAED